MGCITTANFAVLINGCPSPSFSASRGLRQGCTLSPLLFLLMVEGLSLLIHNEKRMGRIKGIRLSSILSITHILFVDDVVLFGHGSCAEWLQFRHIVDLFCAATCMASSCDKSAFLYHNIASGLLDQIRAVFPYKMEPIHTDFRYLGYRLKPLDYMVADWSWLVIRFEQKINHWTYHFLTPGGRLILIKSVLEALLVYWLSLIKIPPSILS